MKIRAPKIHNPVKDTWLDPKSVEGCKVLITYINKVAHNGYAASPENDFRSIADLLLKNKSNLTKSCEKELMKKSKKK